MTRRCSESFTRLLETDNNYNFTHAKRGFAIIINNINFSPDCGLPDRKCAENDHKKVEKVFKALNFRVEICLDLTADDMVDKMREVACNINYDHTAADCFVCTVLTHGGDLDEDCDVSNDVLLGVDGKIVYTRDLVSPFRDETCPYLHGKPKLFFIEACRQNDIQTNQEPVLEKQAEEQSLTVSDGSSENTLTDFVDEQSQTTSETGGLPCEEDQSTQPSNKRIFSRAILKNAFIHPTPLYKDVLVMYATPPGYSSGWSRTGSQFAHDLEHVFVKEALQQSSLLSLLARLCNRMISSLKCESQKEGEGDEEETLPLPLPCVLSMLTKDLYFKR